MLPTCRVPSIRSFMRLSKRRKVDFPQPDGPMRAVTDRSGMARLMSNRAWLTPYQNDRPWTSNFMRDRVRSGDSRPFIVRSEMMAEYERVDKGTPHVRRSSWSLSGPPQNWLHTREVENQGPSLPRGL